MIRVILADDQAMVRGALAALPALEAEIETVAQAGNGDAALPAAPEPRPGAAKEQVAHHQIAQHARPFLLDPFACGSCEPSRATVAAASPSGFRSTRCHLPSMPE